MKRRAFTLLELLIGMSLLTSIGGVIGLRVAPLIQKKQFHNEVSLLKNELASLHQMALTTQSDWSLVITREENGWSLQENCTKTPRLCTKHLKPIRSAVLSLDDAPVKDLTFTFYATGLVLPEGKLACALPKFELSETIFPQERQ